MFRMNPDEEGRSLKMEEELRRLDADGLLPHDRIWVGHFFSHFGAEWEERQKFREALRGAGFGVRGEVNSDEEITGDGYWHHWAYTETRASAKACKRLDRIAEKISVEHGVRYDGWMVARGMSGIPRNLSDDYRTTGPT
jgi:hypothetical protein